MNKKYELTDEINTETGTKLHRIKALISFRDVKAGDLGGWIESEGNLDPEGNAWVYDNAKVFDGAHVFGNASVRDCATVQDNAVVMGYAQIYGRANVRDRAIVRDNAEVYGYAQIYGSSVISDNAIICHCAEIGGNTEIASAAYIKYVSDYICIKGLGSAYRVTTAYRNKTNGVTIKCGCFCGGLSAFKQRIKATHGRNKYAQEYLALIKVIKAHCNN